MINYTVACSSAFWKDDVHTSNTIFRNITFSGLNHGTRYKCEVRVVAGNLTSKSASAEAMTGKETPFCLFMKQPFMIMIFKHVIKVMCFAELRVFLQTDSYFLVFKTVFISRS